MILKWIRYTYLYLIVAGLLGLFLRINLIFPIEGINFRHWVHAHSHVAFLGWIFNALFCAIIYAFIPEKVARYRTMFIALQIAVLGMLFTFPFQGYAAASITFSTLHIFLSWWFAVRFFRDRKNSALSHTLSLSILKWGIVFMVISSVGPFALGAIMAQGLEVTSLNNLAIYFYLHFQYNGWFTFAVFGLFFWLLENKNILISSSTGKILLRLLVISCFTGYVLSALWTQPPAWLYGLAFLTAIVLLVSLAYLLIILKSVKDSIAAHFQKPLIFFFLFAFVSYCLKIFMQSASAFPYFADLAYRVRNLPIGFLHLVLLGFISVFLISWFFQTKLVKAQSAGAIWGFGLFVAGFVLSELIILTQPLFILAGKPLPYGNEILAGVSVLMPLGFILLFLNANLNSEIKDSTLKD